MSATEPSAKAQAAVRRCTARGSQTSHAKFKRCAWAYGIVFNGAHGVPRVSSRQRIETTVERSGEAIENALASVAVKDLETAVDWYESVLGRPGDKPMPEVAEWRFPRGGCLQVYRLPERAGNGSFTLAVDDIDSVESQLAAIGIDTSQRSSNDRVDTLMVTDPDGNHFAFAEAHDPALAR